MAVQMASVWYRMELSLYQDHVAGVDLAQSPALRQEARTLLLPRLR